VTALSVERLGDGAGRSATQRRQQFTKKRLARADRALCAG